MYDNVLHGATGSNVDKIFYQLLHLIKLVFFFKKNLLDKQCVNLE